MTDNDKGIYQEMSLDILFNVLKQRKNVSTEGSYTAQLLADFPDRPARKLVEEAVETLMAAMQDDCAGIVRESADVLYHLMVVLVGAGIELEDVYQELARRAGVSGLD